MLKKYALDSEAREWRRLQKDVRFLCELQHPHVAELQHVFETEDTELGPTRRVAYVQLRHYSGGDLATWLWPLPGSSRAEPEPLERIRLLQHLALALQHLHAHGVAHGDVKLANVLVSCEVCERSRHRRPERQLLAFAHRPHSSRRRARARARCSPTSRRAGSSRTWRCRG